MTVCTVDVLIGICGKNLLVERLDCLCLHSSERVCVLGAANRPRESRPPSASSEGTQERLCAASETSARPLTVTSGSERARLGTGAPGSVMDLGLVQYGFNVEQMPAPTQSDMKCLSTGREATVQ